MITIANPIYDVVFKYLMEDLKVARIVLSVLIGKRIVQLNPLPQELSVDREKNPELVPPEEPPESSSKLNLSVYRLDFAARLKTEEGKEELIIIEIQKARTYHDSMRFRRYLGKQYMNPELYFLDQEAGKERKYGIPIWSVYFLGECLPGLEDHPVLHVHSQLEDRYSKEVFRNEEKFLRSLYHEGIIVMIPALKPSRRDELEQLLSIFDQSNRTKDMHIMNIKLEDYPKRLRPVLQRLQKAAQNQEVRSVMDEEDEFLREMEEYAVRLNDAERRADEAQRREEKAQREKEEERRQKEEERRQKEEERRQKEKAILLMLRIGLDKQIIADNQGKSLEEIEEIETRNRL
jgi:hypothetical protein